MRAVTTSSAGDASEQAKTRLLLVLKNPLTVRDHDRMGLAALDRHFDLTVLDCSPWLMPRTSETRVAEVSVAVKLISVHSLGELRSFLAGVRGGFVIDYVGYFSTAAILMFHQLKRAGLKIVAIDSGAFPLPEEWKRPPLSVRQLAYAWRSQFVLRAIRGIGRRVLRSFLPDQSADIALVAGTSWMQDPRLTTAKKKIPAHSFDYEKYRSLKAGAYEEGPVEPYAVYIDESLPFHEDNPELGYDAPVSPERFTSALSRFFSEFEAATGLPIRIAGYPSAQQAGDLFGGRAVEFGRTAELIRGAEIVFAHASTAISYGVLWRRPIVFLTTPELNESWYFPWVKAPCEILGRPLVDIEAELPLSGRFASWFALDEQAYARYETTYLRAPEAPDLSLWEIFTAGIEAATAEARSGEGGAA